ncbi:cell surface protein [Methylocella silvestris]|uniref:Cell surface protein n=1 Tax=Methylocella silvestris TaxID=199596 RepID=A0A2J7TK73_METSI|nr:cell surface protein [Methylocella silvestris]PNG27166.1 cell surface protein [Methylocella silvestris]
MNDVVLRTPMQYLDRANGALRELGLLPAKIEAAPINALLEKISDLDPEKIAVIAKTLGEASVFNEVVRNETAAMSIGQRYQEIAKSFDSIRDDAKMMVDQLDDGKIDLMERVNNVWMKVSRGDIGVRFDKIRSVYLEVTAATHDQIDREGRILEAYRDFRGAMKQSEVMALEVQESAEAKLEAAKAGLKTAADAVANFAGTAPAERANLELVRDEHLRRVQNEEKRYQIAKDLADNLTISYNTSEVIMARLMQTTNAKERVYAQSVSFFSTNDSVLTALRASFTGLFGLHESTATLDAMKEGVSKSIEVLAEIGGSVQEAALRSGYGPTIRADAVKKLVDSVVNYQERAIGIVDEMRDMATKNSTEIRDAVEAGNRRIAQLITEGKAFDVNG